MSNAPVRSPTSLSPAPFVFPVIPGFTLAQSWAFAPANPPHEKYALIYANNRCYAFYLVGQGLLRPQPGQTHISVVAPDTFFCPYKFRT